MLLHGTVLPLMVKNVGRGVTLSGNCTLNNSVIKNCTRVGGSGPGVYMRSGSELIPVILSNCDVTNNTIQIDDNNSSVKGGAGIYVTDGSAMAQISNCNITNNTIEGLIASGGLYCVGGGVLIHEGVIQDCYFNENHVINSVNATYASHNFTAGAIAIIPKPTTAAANVVLIDGCTITNSTSVSRGGAILIDPRWSGQYHGNYTISDTKIINNKSNDVAGGILCTSPTVQTGTGWTLNLENCLIANNTGNTGGGMFVNTGMVLNITNATVVNNQSKLQYGGGGIHLPGPGNHTIAATLKNVLFWGNVQKDGVANIGRTQFGNSGQPSTIVFTAIQDYNAGYSGWNTTTTGNLINLSAANNDAFDGPAFAVPSSVVGYGATDALTADWHLTASSVCIDAGDDFIAFDIDGTSRPLGDYSDIGAYEFDATALGLEDVKDVIDFKIYPTLTRSIVNIKTIKSIKQIEIFNMSGSSVLKTKEKETIKVSSFATGMYILKVTFDDNVTTVRRFVKK